MEVVSGDSEASHGAEVRDGVDSAGHADLARETSGRTLLAPRAERVASLLNEHGYPFHYAVLEKARRLQGATSSPWILT